jgi:hypothetical protein
LRQLSSGLASGFGNGCQVPLAHEQIPIRLRLPRTEDAKVGDLVSLPLNPTELGWAICWSGPDWRGITLRDDVQYCRLGIVRAP